MIRIKHILVITFLLTASKIASQDLFFESTCDCISKIENHSNESKLVNQTKACLIQATTTQPEAVKRILQDYLAKNPDKNKEFAEENTSEILSEELKKKCPVFAQIDTQLRLDRENSENIIKTVANDICIELKKQSNLTKEIANSIRDKSVKKYLVSIYGQYNLKDQVEFKKFKNDLKSELMKQCDIKKLFNGTKS
ncbi:MULTISPECIES: hypothetical protein [Bizionia]|uniref:Uncharacterized protein n=1 Tax=Bizionia algoritergicola TaxID=291187 RepID=A0A5D0QVH9_9FLAO|nr:MULTISPECIES: hypothetical protein [Bizionia]OBX22985.1 hypothetical protein BAA08_06865 [Bizionia sp. APA-3]TYB72701.1 hypothetical protein ES675_09090 [Bizionia algoritergicola]